jgi:hypothetical protein
LASSSGSAALAINSRSCTHMPMVIRS